MPLGAQIALLESETVVSPRDVAVSSAELGNFQQLAAETIYRQHMTGVDSHGAVDVERWIADLAARLGDRLPEVVSVISASLREDIPELRDEAQIALLNASIEGNSAPSQEPSVCGCGVQRSNQLSEKPPPATCMASLPGGQ
jgi:hypothetical protein